MAQGHDLELQQYIGWLGTDKGKEHSMGAYGILRFKAECAFQEDRHSEGRFWKRGTRVVLAYIQA